MGTSYVGKNHTPPAEKHFSSGCAVAIIVFTATVAAFSVYMGSWLLLLCAPGFLFIVYWANGVLLLFRALFAYRSRGIVGVLVTSDSPIWAEYIRENWLRQFGERFVVLNWSTRRRWGKTLASRIFYYYCGSDRNFCPAIILLRGLRYPLVFRFFYAFRDYKHGNEMALRGLEARLARELKPVAPSESDR